MDKNDQTNFPAFWEICMQLKKQQLEPYMEQKTVQIEKGVCQVVYCHPAYLISMQSTSWEMHKL